MRKLVFTFLMGLIILTISVNAYPSQDNQDAFLGKITNISNGMTNSYDIDGKIRFSLQEIEIGSAEAKRYPFGNYVIILDSNKLIGANDAELKGMLAHELTHLESYSEMSFPGFLVFALKYGLSENYRAKIERGTDMRAIEKGFGKELLAFREYRMRTGSEDDIESLNKYYLSPEEIESLID